MPKTVFYIAFALAASIAGSAAAQSSPGTAPSSACEVKRVASIPLFMTQELGEVYMQAAINGTPKYIALALGDEYNVINREVAQELGLQFKHISADTDEHAFVSDLRFGGFNLRNVDFTVGDRGKHWGAATNDLAGLMAPNPRFYDVELDMAAGQMNLFQPSTCIEGPYWANASAASIDLRPGRNNLFYFSLVLDGKHVQSDLDTGLTTTVLRRVSARALFDIDPAAMHLPEWRGTNGSTYYSVMMHSLATEDGVISITNPHFTIVPGWSREYENDQPVVTLGLSTLKSLHVYVAFARRKMFITAASGPPHINLELANGHFRPLRAVGAN